ncbi:unnamed protein product [Caenorhabditis bovis]|uniref:Bestrophin homolog n=1 Tax=Caenorhabditis bovis TaxID=2654633 RepID=A0A8S1F961_9PELO|nr:unnamed protein product [Caenorhabditis bovis]
MTVSYNLDVSSVSFLNFFKVLFRWRGSVWKSVWTELLLWIMLYYIVYCTYWYTLSSAGQQIFRELVQPISDHLDQCVPLTFMLAFFVTVIVDRWKNIFANIGFIENTALAIATLIRGDSPEIVLSRRTIIRYLVLSQVLVFRDISLKVRRRFPNTDSIIKAGFMLEHEAIELDEVNCVYNKYWVPINWASAILHKMFAEGKITAAPLFNSAWQEIKSFRSNMALLCNFDWVPIPLAYPQVIFVAVRFYFFMCLFSRQHLDHQVIDLYFPLLTVFQFIFFMGWLKVAEGLLNPLGEDDDDFECNFLIDKNIATGMAIVDQTYDHFPEMRQDKFAEPEFSPFYPEKVINTGTDHALVGSAQTVTLAEPNDNIDMMKVDLNSHLVKGIERKPSTFRRLSSAFGGMRARSHSVQPATPVKLEPESPFSQSLCPQRPYGAFELSNGFKSAFQNSYSQSHLPKLVEEDGISVKSHVLDDEEPPKNKPSVDSELGPSTPLPFDSHITDDLRKMKF